MIYWIENYRQKFEIYEYIILYLILCLYNIISMNISTGNQTNRFQKTSKNN